MIEREFFAELASRIDGSLSAEQCNSIADVINHERLTRRFAFPGAVVVLQTAFDWIVEAWDYGRGDAIACRSLMDKAGAPVRRLLEALASEDPLHIREAADDLARIVLARV